ncbi:MAG TPA: protein phosphatase 2C domain-containing protein, partial [Solirubrobacteraceae bacterium]
MLRVAEHFERTDTGRQRRGNEDAFYARAPLFAVADGMGGAQAGEVASHLAVEVLEQGLPGGDGSVEERLRARVREANARIMASAQADDARAGMGTTLTVAYVGEDDLTVAHVGDSRLYRLRDGTFERLTDDHSLVEELVRQGKLTPEEADEHPQRSIITRALGAEEGVEADSHTWAGRDGDVYLIC